MTTDERFEKLLTAQERLDASQQRLDASQQRLDAAQQKTQIMLAQVVDSIMRLERIALAHAGDIDDIQKRLDELEQKARRRKPQ